jgi:hypothetical protein
MGIFDKDSGGDVEDNSPEAAALEGEYAERAARDAAYGNRPDSYNPIGSTTYGQDTVIDPATGEPVTRWTENNSLNPESQRMFDAAMYGGQQQQDASSYLLGNVTGQAPVDTSQFGATDMNNYGSTSPAQYNPGQGDVNQFGQVTSAGEQNLGSTDYGNVNTGQFGQVGAQGPV